jgi:hypothetical protein
MYNFVNLANYMIPVSIQLYPRNYQVIAIR